MDYFYFWLNTIANLLQVENYNLNLKDATNTEINKHLQLQDKILSENIEIKKLDFVLKVLYHTAREEEKHGKKRRICPS